MPKSKKQKPIYFYQLNAEAAKRGLTNTDMARIGAMSTSTYSLKKNGKCPWLLNECLAYCTTFNRDIYGMFVSDNNSNE